MGCLHCTDEERSSNRLYHMRKGGSECERGREKDGEEKKWLNYKINRKWDVFHFVNRNDGNSFVWQNAKLFNLPVDNFRLKLILCFSSLFNLSPSHFSALPLYHSLLISPSQPISLFRCPGILKLSTPKCSTSLKSSFCLQFVPESVILELASQRPHQICRTNCHHFYFTKSLL